MGGVVCLDEALYAQALRAGLKVRGIGDDAALKQLEQPMLLPMSK